MNEKPSELEMEHLQKIDNFTLSQRLITAKRAGAGLTELARLFLRLGVTGFGGPAAHIAMMHNEVVTRRKWLSDHEFLDLVGATNLIPGPNSTEMSIHIGFLWAGWRGLIIAGVCFIIPATFSVLALSWAYVQFSSTPQAKWLFYGIKPVVIVIIVQAFWALGQKSVKGMLTAIVGVAVLLMYFAGVNEIALLFAGGLIVMLSANLHQLRAGPLETFFLPLSGLGVLSQATIPFQLSSLFFSFLKIDSVLYGSGYVPLAFLRSDFVVRFGWLTDQ